MTINVYLVINYTKTQRQMGIVFNDTEMSKSPKFDGLLVGFFGVWDTTRQEIIFHSFTKQWDKVFSYDGNIGNMLQSCIWFLGWMYSGYHHEHVIQLILLIPTLVSFTHNLDLN